TAACRARDSRRAHPPPQPPGPKAPSPSRRRSPARADPSTRSSTIRGRAPPHPPGEPGGRLWYAARPMRKRHAGPLVLAIALVLPCVVLAGDAAGPFAPYEDLTQGVADLTWHLGDDVYRLPPPRDPTGHDLF